jgi:SWI/SNF-related matrix-associated actin-dependent regulator 1 of chromatin subfamily A
VAKTPAALDYIRGVLESEQKLVVFAHHHDVLHMLREGLAEYNPVMYTGEESQQAREDAKDAFQTDQNIRVFLGSIEAAGQGITLTAASTVIFVELDWVPGIMQQAEDRLHRYGQVNPVLVQHLVVLSSIDAKLSETLLQKQAVIDAALDKDISEARGRVKLWSADIDTGIDCDLPVIDLDAERESKRGGDLEQKSRETKAAEEAA